MEEVRKIEDLRRKKIYVAIMFLLVIVTMVVNVLEENMNNLINYVILFLFSLDTFHALWKSKNKKEYFKYHFLDFVALIPFYHGFRMLKFIPLTLQLIRITSIGQRYFLPVVLRLREIGTGRLLNAFLLIFIFLPLPLLWLEPNIKDYGDLIWWEMQTVTTVGYGDIVIETSFGRAIGIVLMVLGVGIITTFTSSVTRALSNPKSVIPNKKTEELDELLKTKNFSMEDLEIIEAWVNLEKKKRLKK